MSATVTRELPDISELTAEQKRALLTLLIKEEVRQQPVPMPILIFDGDELIGQFNPKIKHPAKTTLPPVPKGYWEEVAKYAQNPGKTFTLEEIEALEESGDVEWLSR